MGVRKLILITALLLAGCTQPSVNPEPPVLVGSESMAFARASHTATPLPDGQVLIAGGCTTQGCGGISVGKQSEYFEPTTGRFLLGPVMVQARAGHTATRLADGRILFAGGYPEEGRPPLASAEIYDPEIRRFTATGSMNTPRTWHTATLLPDGRVLIAGGDSAGTTLSTVEIYEPLSGQFKTVGPMPSPRAAHAAVLLGTGQVLVVGGRTVPGHGNGIVATTALFDVGTSSWRASSPLKQAKYKLAAAPLPGGGALVIGGQTADDAAARLRETEIFDPAAEKFSPGPDMAEPRYKISDAFAVLADGRIVIAGNMGAEVYADGRFTAITIPAGGPERQFPAVAGLKNGKVLITGGYSEQTVPTSSAILVTP